MAGVFHVQFGINETPLTQALEGGRFDAAEKMIKECTTASYLDEGCYTRTPLIICLKPECCYRPVNFHIAKLLVERGADPNIRIPNTDGAEFIDPGQTPLELVMELFSRLVRCSFDPDDSPAERGARHLTQLQPVIGMNKEPVTTLDQFQEQVYQLCSVLLGYGANVNVIDKFGGTPLDKLVRSCQTMPKLLELFLENGADSNASNGGFTPLMNLCCIRMGGENYSGRWRKYAGGCLLEGHKERNLQQLETVFELGNVEIDKTNRRGQTALFVACGCGHFAQGKVLLREGASPDIKGAIYEFRSPSLLDNSQQSSATSDIVNVTPVISALVSPHVQDEVFDYPEKPLNILALGDLIDSGKLCSEVIWKDFSDSVMDKFSSFAHLLRNGPKLINLMFGNTSTDLVQKSARVIFRNLSKAHGSLEWKEGKMSDLKTLNLQNYWRTDQVSVSCDKEADLSTFISTLRLPADLVERFEIEWLRLCMCAYYTNAMMAFSFSTNSYMAVESDSDSDELENDSDMEYW